MSWKYQTHLYKSRSREDDFSSKFRSRRAADNEFPTCETCHGQLRMRIMTKQTNSYSSSFSFSNLRLSIDIVVNSFLPALSTDYERRIVFMEPISDKVLLGHLIRRELVSDEGQCRVKCYMEPSCVSINVGPMNQVTKTCDLNDATVESSPGSTLEQKIGYLHLAVEVRFN